MFIYTSPTSAEDFSKYFIFRWEILRKPLNLPLGSEQDELENHAFHTAAYNDQNIIGAGRLHIEKNQRARIYYMAVYENYQLLLSLILVDIALFIFMLAARPLTYIQPDKITALLNIAVLTP